MSDKNIHELESVLGLPAGQLAALERLDDAALGRLAQHLRARLEAESSAVDSALADQLPRLPGPLAALARRIFAI